MFRVWGWFIDSRLLLRSRPGPGGRYYTGAVSLQFCCTRPAQGKCAELGLGSSPPSWPRWEPGDKVTASLFILWDTAQHINNARFHSYWKCCKRNVRNATIDHHLTEPTGHLISLVSSLSEMWVSFLNVESRACTVARACTARGELSPSLDVRCLWLPRTYVMHQGNQMQVWVQDTIPHMMLFIISCPCSRLA